MGNEDYEELKRKYGASSEQKESGRPMKLVAVAISAIIIVALFAYFFYFAPSYNMNAVLSEINSLSPDTATINAISSKKCQSLAKANDYWLVGGCKDGVEFKIMLTDDGYYLLYCTEWVTRREAYDKLKAFLPISECVDESVEDGVVESRGWDLGYEVYNICGLKTTFKDGCILSVSKL